jgi:hypothetical protein
MSYTVSIQSLDNRLDKSSDVNTSSLRYKDASQSKIN